jgi:WD40 repeat protein
MRKFARRNKRALATAGTLALMLFVAVGTVVVSALWAAEQLKARLKVEADAKKKLKFNLYLRNIPLAQVEAKHLNWGGVEDLLRECPEELRGWEYHYLKRLPDAPLVNAIAPVTGGISANLDLAFSPDGRLLAGPGPNNSVTVWDLVTGKQRSLKGNSDNAGRGRVLCVAFRPSDGRLVISASSDGTLRFWDPETGHETRDELKAHNGEIVGMTFSLDGRRLATIGADEIVKVWDLQTQEKPREFPTVHRDQARMLRRASFSPDGRHFAYGAGNAVMVFDFTTRQLTSLKGHKDLVYSVTFSPQGDRLLSASWDLTAKIWNRATGEERFTIQGHACAAWAVEFSPKGDLVAVAGSVADPAVKIYDAHTGNLVHSLIGHATRVGCVAFHPDGKRLVSCSVDQTIRIWELDQGKEVLTLRGHSDLITRVLFDPKGWWLASSSNDRKLQVWDGTPLDAAIGRPCVSLVGHTRQVFGLNFSPDGQQLVSASQDKTVRVWNVATAREVHTLRGHNDTVFAAAFGRDGLLVSGSYDQTTRVWDARTGVERRTLESPETRARGLALSHDGKMLVTSSITPPFQLWRWDMHQRADGPQVERRSPRLAGHNGPAFGVAFNPDDTLIATAGTDGVVKLWDATNGHSKLMMAQAQDEDRSWAVAFHPTNRGRLAAGYSDNRVMIWDFGDAKQGDTRKAPTEILKGHTHDVYCVAYSPDGRWLASASWHEVIIWDTMTYKEVHRIGGFRGLIWSVAWSPDRLLLAMGGGHEDVGTIELWDLTDLPAKAAAIKSDK